MNLWNDASSLSRLKSGDWFTIGKHDFESFDFDLAALKEFWKQATNLRKSSLTCSKDKTSNISIKPSSQKGKFIKANMNYIQTRVIFTRQIFKINLDFKRISLRKTISSLALLALFSFTVRRGGSESNLTENLTQSV